MKKKKSAAAMLLTGVKFDEKVASRSSGGDFGGVLDGVSLPADHPYDWYHSSNEDNSDSDDADEDGVYGNGNYEWDMGFNSFVMGMWMYDPDEFDEEYDNYGSDFDYF